MPAAKYTKDQLSELAKDVFCFADIARAVGLKGTGNSVTHIKSRCVKFGVDTSHFTGSRHGKSEGRFESRTAESLLVEHDSSLARISAARLKKALFEIGRHYKCEECGVDDEWNGKPLALQIDHKDGRYWNNTPANLRFICPNCHSQTDNYGSKNKDMKNKF